MSFENLPADWPTRPVTDPAITADVLDLVIGERDRDAGALAMLICGPGSRLVQPVVVPTPPTMPRAAERRRALETLCAAGAAVRDLGPGSGLLFALARPGRGVMTRDDRTWRNAVVTACAAVEVELFGVWLVTPALIRSMPVQSVVGAEDRTSA